MIRSLLIVSLFLLSLSSMFAFDITNEAGEEKTFFSVNDPKVEIISENNFQNFTITYTLLNSAEQEIFNLSSCGSNFCGSFLLTNLIQSLNDTFVGSKTFTISVGPINRSIFFDLENPTFTLNSLVVNNSAKKVELDFLASDNSGIVKSLLLFKEIGSTQTQIANLTGKTTHEFSLENSQDFSLIFKATDIAGNVQEHEEEVNVTDIFDPVITKTLIIQNEDNSYSLEFAGTDDNLSSYSITQDSLSLSESISGTSVSKTVSLPFTEGSIVLKITDVGGNSASKTITLSEGSLELSSVLQYTNKKEFSFKSSEASSCELTGINDESVEKSFSKSGSNFELSLSLDDGQGEYLINFTCEDSSSRAFFSKELIYDTEEPTKIRLEAEADEDGEIRLNWTKSTDELSGPVKYQIFRDDDKEAEQSNDLDFRDDEVEYPKEYEYFIRAVDKAGNSVDSNTITITPLKVAVRLDSNFNFRETVDKAEQRLEIYSEEGAKIIVTHLFDDEEIAKIIFESLEDDIQDFDLRLKEGENEIILEAEDSEGNTKEKTFFLTLESQVANTISANQDDESLAASQNKNNESETISTVQETEEGTWTFWLWILIFLVLLGVFIWFFIVREPERKKAMMHKDRVGWAPREKKRNTKSFLEGFGSSKDHYLEKDLRRIKQRRLEKQREDKERKEREQAREAKKIQEPQSEFQKQKLKDLAGRREIAIPFAKRQEARKRVENIEKEMGEKNFEREEQRNSSKKEKKFDPFSEYLNSSRIKRSWDSTTSYRARKELPKEDTMSSEEERVDPNQVQKTIEESQKKEEVIEEKRPEKKKLELDEYLNKRTKKRRWYFTERDVNRDLKSRRE